MPKAARNNGEDIGPGKCNCHGDQSPLSMEFNISTGSPNTFINGKAAARLTDVVTHTGTIHTGQIISGSATCFVNGLSSARLDDVVGPVSPNTCIISGAISTGSDDTYIG